MNHRTIVSSSIPVLSALFLAHASVGQGYLYSPSFLATSEGAERVALFGYRPAMRFQMVDGEIRGNAVALKEVALRLNETTGQSPWWAHGRMWSRVDIRIATGDRRSFGTDFTKNMLSTPTLVFSSSVSWPSINVPQSTRPAPWGGAAGAYRFPFRSRWLHSVNTDVVTDWTFRGGTLANSFAWSSTTLWLYEFDGFGGPSSVAVSNARRLPSPRLNNDSPGVTSRCNDSFTGPLNNGAYLNGGGWVYGSAPSNPAFKNKLVVRSQSWLTAPNSTVIHGWGLATNETGIDIGTGCNRLHLGGPFVLIPVTASAGGVGQPRDLVTPWQSAYANAIVTMQAAWSDSQTKRIALTQALELRLPGHAPGSRPVLRSSIYESDVESVKGPFTDGNHNPALRYAYY